MSSLLFSDSISRIVVLLALLTWGAGAPTLAKANFPAQAPSCFQQASRALLVGEFPQGAALLETLEAFAREHRLPSRVMSFGPEERRVERLLVAVDVENAELLKAYREKFNLDAADKKSGLQGTLALEFSFEKPEGGHYVTGVLRPGATPDSQIFRWGRPDLKLEEWWQNWMSHGNHTVDKNRPIWGYGHLVGLNEGEVKNIRHFLNHSDVVKRDPIVAPCKDQQCVAWTTMIELGRSDVGVPDAERRFLFNELGVSRTVAHFEISRRLTHAANQRHAGMVVFVRGEEGIKAFSEIEKYLPPLPKSPFSQIVRGVVFRQDEALRAMEQIPDGAKIFMPIAAGASPEGFSALVKRAVGAQKGFELHTLVNGLSEAALNDAIATVSGKLRIKALFLGGNLRAAHQAGKVDVIPGYLGDFTRWVRQPDMTDFHYDAIVVRVAPADPAGRHSLGPNYDMILSIIRDRRSKDPNFKVIAEVNPNVPRTTGENFLKADEINSTFASTAELAGPPILPLNPTETKIGENLATLLKDARVMQFGIGNIFGGVPQAMRGTGAKGIRVFTEMLGDHVKGLMEDGIVEAAEAGFAYGSKGLYQWLDQNPRVIFRPTEYVNNPGAVAAKPGFHAVNTALQVNLRGDVNAVRGLNGRISSPGGQVEFMAGAAKSEGGKAIIAIRSTAKDETISSIALDLYGGEVTTPHEMVTHVVTEFGVANLRGKSLRERAVELIQVAHPKFRPELVQEALARKMISAEDAELVRLD